MIKLPFKILTLVLTILVGYAAFTFGQVWWTSRQHSTVSAGSVVVMGAAQWNGKPSPVLKARLDHAADLYKQGRAKLIVVTGGKQPGDRVTQGHAGHDYLTSVGVPDGDIRVEVQGTNSYQELSAAAGLVRDAGRGPSVLLVSDPYHSMRIAQIAEELGLEPHLSPAATPSPLRSMLRETAAVGVGRLIGYRRLASWW